MVWLKDQYLFLYFQDDLCMGPLAADAIKASWQLSEQIFGDFLALFCHGFDFSRFLTVSCEISDFCHNFVRFLKIFATYFLDFWNHGTKIKYEYQIFIQIWSEYLVKRLRIQSILKC